MDTSLDSSSSTPTLSSISSTSSLTLSEPATTSSSLGTTVPVSSVPSPSSPIASTIPSTSHTVHTVHSLTASSSATPSSPAVVRSRAPDLDKDSPSTAGTAGGDKATSESSKPASDDPVSPTPPSAPKPPTSSPHASPTPPTTHSSSPPSAPSTPPKPSNPAPAQTSSKPREADNQGPASSAAQPKESTSVAQPKESTPVAQPKESAPSNALNTTQATTQSIASDKTNANMTLSSSTSRGNTSQNAVSATAANSSSKSSATALHHQLATIGPTLTSNGQGHLISSGASTPTSALSSGGRSGFFANRGTVAGVFVIVGLVALGLIGLFVMGLCRRCRRRQHEMLSESRQPALAQLNSNSNRFESESHYRRMSQVLALGNPLTAGAAGVGAHAIRRNPSLVRSDDSHARSLETYHSGEPIIRSEKNPFTDRRVVPSPVPEDLGVPPYQQQPTNPFYNASRYSLHSEANSSPSIYPPTLPALNAEEDDRTWRIQERRHTPDYSQEEEDIVQQPRMPPYSSLGLWTGRSQTTLTPYNISENEIVRNLHPHMQPDAVHKGSTAPITSTGAPKYRYDGGYLLNSTWTVPNRGGSSTKR